MSIKFKNISNYIRHYNCICFKKFTIYNVKSNKVEII
jgi:hypothetical protein